MFIIQTSDQHKGMNSRHEAHLRTQLFIYTIPELKEEATHAYMYGIWTYLITHTSICSPDNLHHFDIY